MNQSVKTITLILFFFAGYFANAQLANNECKFLGNVIPDVTPSDFKTYWNQVTPENAGKWGSVESTRDVMTWDALDNAYNYAKDNQFPFKQHTLVWGQQQPSWISTLSPAEQLEEVEEWIKGYCERYPETEYIDVVNEPLHAPPSYAAALGGSGNTGWDWVIWSFEKARAYCPNAKLILNDYNIISSDAATNTYITIINLLKSRGLIDVVGEQGHFMETTPTATVKKNLDKLHATGFPIHISEYDLNFSDDNAQAAKYKEQFPVLWKHPGVQGITLWGYKEGQIWREDSYLIRANGTARPALTWLTEYMANNQGETLCNPVTAMSKEAPSMRVYPNPSTNGTFMVDPGEGRFVIRILDIRGHVKKEFTTAGSDPVMVHLKEPAGLYFVQVHNGSHSTYEKIILD